MGEISGSRARTVSSTSNAGIRNPEIATLVGLLSSINFTSPNVLREGLEKTTSLPQLRYLLKDESHTNEAKGDFRRAGGFHAFLNLLSGLAGLDRTNTVVLEDPKWTLQTLDQLLSVFSAAIEGHSGNDRYFRTRVGSSQGGWPVVQSILKHIHSRLPKEHESQDHFYGILLAAALDREVMVDSFVRSNKNLRQQRLSQDIVSSSQHPTPGTRTTAAKLVEGADNLVLPEVLSTAILISIHDQAGSESDGKGGYLLLYLCTLESLLLSRKALVSAHNAELLSTVLPSVFEHDRDAEERDVLKDIALLLCQEGISTLSDAQLIFQRASASTDAASFLVEAIELSRNPPCFQFDLSERGYSCAELPTLGRAFPAAETNGYTLSLWVHFDEFDSQAHTTLFGAFDRTQTCFVLAYLEKDTRHLILQTAVKGSRPSVRFKTVAFELGQWYHITIVHRKARFTSAARATLFVDGQMMEHQKATFPNLPPADRDQSHAGVQTFLGTPQNLSPNPTPGVCKSKWRLASAVLFSDLLSDDLVSVISHLGYKYHGNFQDCLGSFQTYEASAALNLRNEELYAGKEDSSDLSIAIRQKACNLIKEESILLNISPTTVLDGDDRNNINETQLIKSLSKQAATTLNGYTRSGGNAIAINGAVPAINDALTQARGVTLLMGEPLISVPQDLADASWQLGGCAPVGLQLLSQAKTTEDVETAVEILFETVRYSWRNSEVMERDNGYAILAMLLKDKLAFPTSYSSEGSRTTAAIPTANLDRAVLSSNILRLVLDFVGYDFDNPSQSVINNPLAYKALLIDTNIWRSGPIPVQMIYFEQFIVFGSKSRHSHFNIKRFTRMRVLKRMLESLKSEPVSKEIMPFYIKVFKTLLPQSMTAETYRALALFITFSVNKRNITATGRKTGRRDTRSRQRSNSAPSSRQGEEKATTLTNFEIGVEILGLYSDFLCKPDDESMIKKFAKTVTNKWLLYLMSESSPEVVVLAMRILARLLIVHGEAYVRKFKDKTGGFTVMKYRLKRWWHLPALWPVCFGILFNVDPAKLDLNRSFDLFGFVDLFNSRKEHAITYPDMLEVIAAMLQSGLKTIVASSQEQSSQPGVPTIEIQSGPPERLSMSTIAPPNPFLTLVTSQHISTFSTVVQFLADLHSRSQKFRDFAVLSNYIQDFLSILFPVVVGVDAVEAITELNARDSTLTFDGADVVVQPLSSTPPVVRKITVENAQTGKRMQPLARGSSYVVVSRESAQNLPVTNSQNGLRSRSSPKVPALNEKHVIVQSMLEIVISIYTEQILQRKDFRGLGLHVKMPPGFIEHQSYFESWILRNTVSELSNQIALNQTCLQDPKVLINLAKLFTHLSDALLGGWFIDGSSSVLKLAGSILEYLQRPEVASNKTVRLCCQYVATIRAAIFRVILLNLSKLEDNESLPFLQKLIYWQNVLLPAEDLPSSQLPLVAYLLYGSLVSENRSVRLAATNLWRLILVQKPGEISVLLGQATSPVEKELVMNFEKLAERDDETFLSWIDGHRQLLDALFLETLSGLWGTYVSEENKRTEETDSSRIAKRRDRLKSWARQAAETEDFIRRHEITFDHWTANIYSSEHLKHQRFNQDQQDDLQFVQTTFRRMERDITGPVGIFATPKTPKWQLDQTEGRNRMRLRLHEHIDIEQETYQPRRKRTDMSPLRLDTRNLRPPDFGTMSPGGITPQTQSPLRADSQFELFPPMPEKEGSGGVLVSTEVEDSFELIEDPNVEDDTFEDKNRKVMRSLHRGDQVKHVANISRIIGLEAVECLLILGKDNIYIIDNFFQRADLEIVSVWQAPIEERDPYVRMISGRDIVVRKPAARSEEHDTRSWKWSEVLSVSKRRFLFRDVAIEIFFADGRSYLFTVMTSKQRNDLFSSISNKAPQYGTAGSAPPEIAWRYETLRSVDDEPQTLGSKFANVFGQSTSMVATRQWQRGEMSNFHYLMLINTMAGRTYNDLTQYPVFPWVIADYTSQELDLTNAKTFRDLSKPMGCQTPAREAEFRERYKSFAEMGDANAPAFHYGTHYSSAMIVTSFLIRLQPFVKSYLLLQGGTFDHPDRMFYSIEQAWRSASHQNMTDVRELTPEFYHLPEFLVNMNGYDFGLRQQSEQSIDTVELPPWAKGDPKIFIQKQREALESPYVSRNLHKWIDLVFGFKQKGEAAYEATNVFHHLSYQGAKDLDAITDPVERLATIGIIHNFGQTPYQIFTRAHPGREQIRHKLKRLDIAAESLTRLPSTLLDSEERIASLQYSARSDRLLCSGAFRLNIPPNHDRYMEWGFSDHSVRFYSADNGRQVGLSEHLHIGQLSNATFADSKTLITAGMDCTISIWSLLTSHKSVELQPRATLFGHRKPVGVLAISRSFNTLLSCSSAGELFLWDLNRCEFMRRIEAQLNVSCACINDVNGNIVICHGSEISMYTLNGELLLRQESGDRPGDCILSCACYEGGGSEWLERELVFTGHKHGVVRIWNKTIRDGRFELEIIRQLNHADESREDGANVAAGISCILPMPQVVYTGDEDGKVYEWNCVQRH